MARYALDSSACQTFNISARREWLRTNGIGGFAMGTVAGVNTRRYHGLLVAATDPPAHRVVLVPNIDVEIVSGTESIGLSANQYQGAVHPEGFAYLDSFSQDHVLRWEYVSGPFRLAKAIAMTEGENTTTIRFANTGTKGYTVVVRPLVSHKFYHANFRASAEYPERLDFATDQTIVGNDGVNLHIHHAEWTREEAVGWYYRFENLREADRGLDSRDDAYCPCVLSHHLLPGQEIRLVLSDQPNPTPFADWDEGEFVEDFEQRLMSACAKFIVRTPSRTSVLAGYPWFTDWGRDTMISLPGICLETGQVEVAERILRDYASQMRRGLIPNRFVEKGEIPEYNTADATLWFVNSCYLTHLANPGSGLIRELWPSLKSFFEHHMAGTDFGIRIDADGLLTQGEEGLQLTWMDAKLGDWVVTPRRGKAVELNGLWINACRILAALAEGLGEDPAPYATAADQGEASFEAKFWKESLGYYLDVAEPDDASLRPNQLFAISLPFGPAKGGHAKRALAAVREHLLTPVGLRTLAPDSVHYRPRFRGPLQELDAAYHQGTVWPWLMGAFIEAHLKLGGSPGEAEEILRNGIEMLEDTGIGGIAEVYDGDEPREAAGCPWQAWSVAEWLRASRLASRASTVVE